MVAFVTGAGLGLLDTTANQFKGAGVFGHGQLGQAGGSSTVNLATGNLILQFIDESLSGTGADLRQMRTYNAQGNVADGDGDRWRWLGEKHVRLNGALNTAGSTVIRTTGDGHEAVYSWNGSAYVSSTGSGADDTIVHNGSEWVWTEGSSKATEVYSASTGWICASRDTSGNGFDYVFTGDRLTKVTDVGSGQIMDLVYNSDNRLERLETRANASAAPIQQVHYAYDILGRLSSVTTDLSLDNSITDGDVYTTTYGYKEGDNSTRIARISQSDGTQVGYTYIDDGGTYKIHTVTDQSGTTTFSYFADRTEVTNGAGQTSRYFFDAEQRLTRAESASVNGQVQSVSYQYDSKDNVTHVTDGKNQTVTYTYDGNSNLTKEVDSLGNTVEHFYSDNRLISSTRYATASLTTPSDPETTRYVYDAAGRVRFTLSAEGRVSESRYNAQGLVTHSINYASGQYAVSGLSRTVLLTEAQLTTWANGQDRTKTTLTRFDYDQLGNLCHQTAYSSVNASGEGVANVANSITKYVYSDYGQLLQTISVTGAGRDKETTLSSNVYDGMGRLESTVSDGVTTSTVYSSKRIAITNSATGLSVATAYDDYGRALSVTSSGEGQNRITKQYYDAAGRKVMTEDAEGGRSYTFYDAAGRVSHTISAEGAVTGFTYDPNGRVTTETHYVNRATTVGWFDGSTVTQSTVQVLTPEEDNITPDDGGIDNRIVTHIDDRITTYVYDNAGRLKKTIEEFGALDRVSEVDYDGAGRVIQSGLLGRESRFFYDKDGRQIGSLNAEGYLTENIYDAAGRLTTTVRYGNHLTQLDASFDALKADALVILPDEDLPPDENTVDKLTTHYYYDAQGRQVGVINEQGYLSETVFDVANHVRYTHLYTTPITSAVGDLTFTQLKAAVGTDKRTTTIRFDDFGRTSTVQSHDGTINRTIYDNAGRAVRTIVAESTNDQTASRTRYNAFGEVTGVVSGEGEAAVSDLNTAIDQYGKSYQYDAMGRKVAELGPQGQKTSYYYDKSGRLTHTINALGEVSITSYNTFGQVETIHVLNERVSLYGITTGNGVMSSDLGLLIGKTMDPAKDKVITNKYNALGLLSSQTNAEGKKTDYLYNQYGDRTDIVSPRSSVQTPYGVTTTSTVTHNEHDKLGRVIKSYADYSHDGYVGINALTEMVYDGYGRVTDVINPALQRVTTDYQSGGRTITVTDPLSRSRTTTYDALGRELTVKDAAGKTTTYTYDDINRSITVTTPEGISATTWKTRTGQTLKVKDGNGNITLYTYTKDGNLETVTDAENNTTEHIYDKSGRLFETIDAKGTVVRFYYDAANRQFLKVVDPGSGGLNIRTHYEFDGQGRKISMIEGYDSSDATETEYHYDRNGRLKLTILDPNGLKLTTRYTYDDAGNTVKVERGEVGNLAQQVSRYEFDALGRKTKEILDPGVGKLNITTQYKYDTAGNVSRIIDANNNSTWFVYNAANEKHFTVNDLGEVTGYEYDLNGQVHHTRQYATRISTSGFGDSVSSLSVVTHDNDRRIYTVRDDDGNEQFTLTTASADAWIVTENVRDANGNIIEARRYSQMLSTDAMPGVNLLASDGVISADEVVGVLRYMGYRDVRWGDGTTTLYETRRSHFAFDAADRLRFAIDAEGYVTETQYDQVGNVLKTISYDEKLHSSQLQGVLTDSIYENSGNTLNWQVYDADPAGATIQKVYDDELGQYVTEVIGSGTGNGYRLREGGTSDWNNTEQTVLSWQMKYGESYTVYISVDTNKGHRYLTYTSSSDLVNAGATGYHYFGLGADTLQGEWTSITRNLADDLKSAESDAIIIDVNAFLVRGSGRIANVVMHNSAEALAERINSLKANDANIDANARTMEYRYDAANRQIAELSSEVTVKASNGTSYTGKIKTEIEHNALGQVTKRHEGIIERSGTSDMTIDRRTTEYRYDKAGNQTLTILAGWYDTGEKQIYQSQSEIINGLEVVQTDRFQRTVEVAYDDLGNAVRNKIRIGESDYVYQYKAYDAAGRKVYDIDGLGYVSGTTYDAMGNIKTETRYDVAVNESEMSDLGYWLANEVRTQVSGDVNARTITHYYDAAGRKYKTVLPTTTSTNYHSILQNPTTASTYTAAGQTNFEYNSFGELVLKQERVDTEAWANTFYYYDHVGRQILVVDPLKYGTRTEYNALGNVVRVTEYANALNSDISVSLKPTFSSSAGKDRIQSFTYDAMGRKLTVTQEDVTYVPLVQGNWWNPPITADRVLSTSQYNAFGEVIQTNEAYAYTATNEAYGYTAGHYDYNTTDFQYNQLGQTTKITAPTRKVASTDDLDPFRNQVDVRPTTTYSYDLFGNVLSTTQSSTAGLGASITLGSQYDHVGNRIRSTDGEGNHTYFRVDVNGRVVTQTQSISVSSAQSDLTYYHTLERRFEYDAVGRQTVTVDIYEGKQTGSRQVFNAFGEVTQEDRIWGSASSATTALTDAIVNSYVYDEAGRVKYKQGADGYTYYYYDLTGNVTRTEQRQGLTDKTLMRITENRHDLLGRILEQRQPSSTATESGAALNPVIKQEYDRWGNVIQRRDAKYATTRYTYNHNSQLTSETNATAEDVYTIYGSSYNASVVRSIQYDLAGRAAVEKHSAYEVDPYTGAVGLLKAVKSEYQVYDAVGNVIRTVDATGKRNDYAYDIHGNKVGSRNGVGTVHVFDYNRKGQIIEQNLLRRSGGAAYNGLDATHTAASSATFELNRYAYDQAGRKYAEHSAGGTEHGGLTEYYQFDARNNIKTKQNVMGYETFYTYDALGNKTSEKNDVPIASWETQLVQYGTTLTTSPVEGSTPNYAWKTVTVQDGYNIVQDPYGYTNVTPVYGTETQEYISGYKTTTTEQRGSTEIWGTHDVEYVYGYTTTTTAQRGSTPLYDTREVTYQSGTKIVSSSYGYTDATPVYSTKEVQYISGYKTTSTQQTGSTPIYENQTVEYIYGYTTTSTAQRGSTPIYSTRQERYISGYTSGPYGSTPVYSYRTVEYISGYKTPIYATRTESVLTGYKTPIYSTKTEQYISGYEVPVYSTKTETYISGYKTPIYSTRQESYFTGEYKTPIYATQEVEVITGYQVPNMVQKEVEYIVNYTSPYYISQQVRVYEDYRVGEEWTYKYGNYAVGQMDTRTSETISDTGIISDSTYSYTYTKFGQLEKEEHAQSSSEVTYRYWQNGLLQTKMDKEAIGGGTRTVASNFYYDVNGRRTVEQHSTTDNTTRMVYGQPVTFNTSSGITTRYAYDTLGRLTQVSSPQGYFQSSGVSHYATELQALNYRYDEWGNRRAIEATYTRPGQAADTKAQWFTYDAEGRTLIENGSLVNGSIVVDKPESLSYTYDSAGRQAQSTTAGHTDYYGTHFGILQNQYDDRGHLKSVERFTHTIKGDEYDYTVSNGVKQSYTYDNRGFQTEAVINRAKTSTTYRNDGQVLSQKNYSINGTLTSETNSYHYLHDGSLQSYRYEHLSGDVDVISRYNYTYVRTYAGQQVSTISVRSTQDNTAKGTTHNTYDHRGRLTHSRIMDSLGSESGYSHKYFSYNAEDRIVRTYARPFGNDARTQTYYYSNGNALANIGDEGINITPIKAQHKAGSTPGTYTINAGDTLSGIAQALYGDGSLWYVIAEANALNVGPTDRFTQADAGRNLRIPNTNHSLQNTSTTFKPYNPGEIIGDLTPSPEILPPPGAGDCNVIATIIVVIIVVVVTVYTAGFAASGAWSWGAGTTALSGGTAAAGGVAGGAYAGISAGTAVGASMVGGFVGSVAGQGVAMGMGVQDSFSLRQAVGSGLTAGFASGMGAAVSSASTGSTAMKKTMDFMHKHRSLSYAANGAATYVASQASTRMVGLETSFSWKGLAASAAGSALGNGVANGLGRAGVNMSDFWGKAARGALAGAATGKLTRQWADGEKVNYAQIALDAFGNQLGNRVGEGLASVSQSNTISAEAQADFEEQVAKLNQGVSENLQRQNDQKTQRNVDGALATGHDAIAQQQSESIAANANAAIARSASRRQSQFAQNAEQQLAGYQAAGARMDVLLTNLAYNQSRLDGYAASRQAMWDDFHSDVSYYAAASSAQMDAVRAGIGTDFSDVVAASQSYSEWRAPQIAAHEAIYGPRRDVGDTWGEVIDIGQVNIGAAGRFGVETVTGLAGLAYDGSFQGMLRNGYNYATTGEFSLGGLAWADSANNSVAGWVASFGPGDATGGWQNDKINLGINIGTMATALGGVSRVRGAVGGLRGVPNNTATLSTRERVLGNIAESRSARNSSNIDIFHARSVQVESGYNADAWFRGALNQGDVVYSLSPNPNPQFFTNLDALQAGRFDSAGISRAVQVKEHPVFGYRPDVTGYRVIQDFNPLQGRATANPQFGPGGADQFLIQNFEKYLEPITTIDLRR